jgi:predicted DNA-binding transcriptional regulator YafY
MEAINMVGIPIVSFPGLLGGFEIMEGYRFSHQVLTKNELVSVMTGLKGLQSHSDDHIVVGTLEKMRALLKKNDINYSDKVLEQWIIDLSPWGGNEEEKKKTAFIRDAIQKKTVITFEYTNSQGYSVNVVVEPASVVHKGYHWYLYGFCRERSKARLYRLSRMRILTTMAETFEREIDPYDAGFIEADWKRNTKTVHLVLRFQPRVKVRVEESFQEGIIRCENNGTMLVEVVYPEDEWVYGMILSYGDAVEVLEPKYLRDIIRDRAMNVWRLYT